MLDYLWNSPLLRLLGTSLSIQWVGWAASAYLHTEKFYDLTGSATFLFISHISYGNSIMSVRQTVNSWAVFAWACRLGSFLFIRIMKDGSDKRFDRARDNPDVLFKFWTIQGVWVFVTLLPTLVLNSERRDPPIGKLDYIGWGLWFTGFVLETVADAQKSLFRADPANQGKFITSGLWSVSRHPNYFGEILLWFGLYLTSSSVFRGAQLLSVLSPVAVMLLITKVSGVPLLEAAGLKKWGESPEYQQYLQNTPVLIPFLKT